MIITVVGSEENIIISRCRNLEKKRQRSTVREFSYVGLGLFRFQVAEESRKALQEKRH